MLTKPLIDILYESAHIQRWNDHSRPPQGFSELDKQAHKAMIAYILAMHEDNTSRIDPIRLLEGCIFEFLHRIVLTDIKPAIYHELMRRRGVEVNKWVLGQLKDKLLPNNIQVYQGLEEYLTNAEYSKYEKKILSASHYFATYWEYAFIYNFNSSLFGSDATRTSIENELEEHSDLKGIQKLWLKKKTYNFIDLVGQLRFQRRWAHSPRTPETSVLGHMFIVAILCYLCSTHLSACKMRLRNNFYGGLFHDLPEVLTRDIVSPVKKSIEGLEDLIHEIEARQVEDKILPLLPSAWHREVKYFMDDEFKSKISDGPNIRFVTSDEINAKYNLDCHQPLDGEIIKACDHFAAYVEAKTSISHGVTSRHLENGVKIADQYRNKSIGGIDFGSIFSGYEKK